MTHDDFFAAAIDPDSRPSLTVRREIVAHRSECTECRALEKDFPRITSIGRRALGGGPKITGGFEEELVALAGTETAKRGRKVRDRAHRRRAVASALLLFLVAGGLADVVPLSSARPKRTAVEEPMSVGISMPKARPEALKGADALADMRSEFSDPLSGNVGAIASTNSKTH